jgi:allophanate hydrolase subunit 1
MSYVAPSLSNAVFVEVEDVAPSLSNAVFVGVEDVAPAVGDVLVVYVKYGTSLSLLVES